MSLNHKGAGSQSGMWTGGTRTKGHMDRDVIGIHARQRSVPVVTKLPASARDSHFTTFSTGNNLDQKCLECWNAAVSADKGKNGKNWYWSSTNDRK